MRQFLTCLIAFLAVFLLFNKISSQNVYAFVVDCAQGVYAPGACNFGIADCGQNRVGTGWECCSYWAQDQQVAGGATCSDACVWPVGDPNTCPDPDIDACFSAPQGCGGAAFCCVYSSTPIPTPTPPACAAICGTSNCVTCPDGASLCGTTDTSQCSVSQPTPTTAPTCSSFTTCGTCVASQDPLCGWTGSSCQAGTSSCPAGYSSWYWFDCLTNQCAAPPTPTSPPAEPTAIPTPTPTPLPAPGLNGSCNASGTTLNYNWNAITGAVNYAIRVDDKVDGPVTDNPLPNDTVKNDIPGTDTSWSRSAIPGHTYEAWVHAVDSRGEYSGSSNHVWVTCAGPTPTPITPTPVPDSIDATPEPNQKQTTGLWQQMTIKIELGTVSVGDVAIKGGDITTTGQCGASADCGGWTDLSGIQNIGSGTYSWNPNGVITSSGTYTFGLFDGARNSLLKTDPVNFATDTINSPSSITKNIDTWPAAAISGNAVASGNKVIIKRGSHTTIGTCIVGGVGDVDCNGWADVCTGLGAGSYSCSYILGSSQPDDTYTYALYKDGAILATSRTNYVLPGAPTPTTAPSQGCTLTTNPTTVSPGGNISVNLSGPGGSYMMTCPDGASRGPGGPNDTWACNVPSSPGRYSVSAVRNSPSAPAVSCSSTVRVSTECDDGTTFRFFFYTYKDTYYNNTTYTSVSNQWPQYFWCSDRGDDSTCTYGTATGNVADAKRNDSTYCGYSLKTGGNGECRLAFFPDPNNYSSRYPFNTSSWLTTPLPNVPVHIDGDCGSYTALTDTDGYAELTVPRTYEDGGRVSYTVSADTPSGRRFTRGSYLICTRRTCSPWKAADEYLGPSSNPEFEDIDAGGNYGENFRFGFTNPGREPVCTGVSAAPTIITRGQQVAFSNATGRAYDGKTIVGYEWDFDGNGTIDQETTQNSTTYTYSGNSGTFNAKLYLKDSSDLFSFPRDACTKPIVVSCNTLQVSPNPVTLSPGQTQPLTPEGIDGDPTELTWTTSDPETVSITGSDCKSPPEEPEGHSLLLQLAKFLNFPIAEATHPSCRPGQTTEKQGQSVQIYAHKEGTATITVSDKGAFNCGLSTRQVVVTVRIPPWFQGTGGDMRMDRGFNDPIPNSVPVNSRYASLEGGGTTPGIVFSGNGTPDFGDGQASKTYNWVAGGLTYPEAFSPVSSGVIRTSYNYMTTTAKQSGITPKPLTANDFTASLQNGLYQTAGDLTLDGLGTYTFPVGKNFVILVNGNLTIAENIIVPQSSTATFSVSGDIIFDKSIGATLASTACDPATHTGCHIEGFYSADGDILIKGNGAPACATVDTTDDDKRVNFAGALVANAKLLGGAILNQRDLCGINNATYPTYTVTERPDFILNAPEFIKAPNSIWEEVAP